MERKEKTDKRMKRRRRIRAKILGTADRPRFCVFRSNRHLVLQLMDDRNHKSFLQLTDRNNIKAKTKTEAACKLGEIFAKKAMEKKIKRVIFDRGGYKYAGRVKAAADGARKAGLEF